MRHDPKQQLEALVVRAVAALSLLPDDERAPLLAEMRTVVFKRAAETYGLRHGKEFSEAFVNVVAKRIDELDNAGTTH